jgi:hypothetical protein
VPAAAAPFDAPARGTRRGPSPGGVPRRPCRTWPRKSRPGTAPSWGEWRERSPSSSWAVAIGAVMSPDMVVRLTGSPGQRADVSVALQCARRCVTGARPRCPIKTEPGRSFRAMRVTSTTDTGLSEIAAATDRCTLGHRSLDRSRPSSRHERLLAHQMTGRTRPAAGLAAHRVSLFHERDDDPFVQRRSCMPATACTRAMPATATGTGPCCCRRISPGSSERRRARVGGHVALLRQNRMAWAESGLQPLE